MSEDIVGVAKSELERLRRYDAPNPRCNSGHVNSLKIALWDCPTCVEEERVKLLKRAVAAEEAGAILAAALTNLLRVIVSAQEVTEDEIRTAVANAREALVANDCGVVRARGDVIRSMVDTCDAAEDAARALDAAIKKLQLASSAEDEAVRAAQEKTS